MLLRNSRILTPGARLCPAKLDQPQQCDNAGTLDFLETPVLSNLLRLVEDDTTALRGQRQDLRAERRRRRRTLLIANNAPVVGSGTSV